MNRYLPARYNQPERWIKFGAAFLFLALFGAVLVKWPDQLGPGLPFFAVLTTVFALATMAFALAPHGRGDEYFEGLACNCWHDCECPGDCRAGRGRN